MSLPTGSTDPFGVRRAALTFLAACERWAPELPLDAALAAACGDAASEATEAVYTYLRARIVRRLRTRGVPPDHVAAVVGYTTMGALLRRVADLEALSKAPGFDRLLAVAERCRNITQAGAKDASAQASSEAPLAEVREDLLGEQAEIALHAVWAPLRAALPPTPDPLSREDAVRVAAELSEPLHTFFEEVFVNAEDAELRANRHALLRQIDEALLRFADLCRIVSPGSSA